MNEIKQQTEIAKTSADAAKESARAALLNTQVVIDGERAWLLGDQIDKLPEFIYNPGQVGVVWINVPIRNFGRTVAVVRETSQQAVLVPRNKTLVSEPEYRNKFPWNNALPPNSTTVLQVGVAEHDFITVKDGSNTLYIYGFVRYSDLGNVMRESRFCYIYHIPGGFNPTPEGFYPCGNCPQSYTECT